MRIMVNFIDKGGNEQEFEFEPTNPVECGVALWGISMMTHDDSEFELEEPETHNRN